MAHLHVYEWFVYASLIKSNNAKAECLANCAGSVSDAEFLENMRHMAGHGVLGDEKVLCDGLFGVAIGKQGDYLRLSFGERLELFYSFNG